MKLRETQDKIRSATPHAQSRGGWFFAVAQLPLHQKEVQSKILSFDFAPSKPEHLWEITKSRITWRDHE
jgi:hypothetical protein